jgi:hypothetical protein
MTMVNLLLNFSQLSSTSAHFSIVLGRSWLSATTSSLLRSISLSIDIHTHTHNTTHTHTHTHTHTQTHTHTHTHTHTPHTHTHTHTRYTSIADRLKIDVILSEKEEKSFFLAMKTKGYSCIDAAFSNIRSQDASATQQNDLDAIRELIEVSSSCHIVLCFCICDSCHVAWGVGYLLCKMKVPHSAMIPPNSTVSLIDRIYLWRGGVHKR